MALSAGTVARPRPSAGCGGGSARGAGHAVMPENVACQPKGGFSSATSVRLASRRDGGGHRAGVLMSSVQATGAGRGGAAVQVVSTGRAVVLAVGGLGGRRCGAAGFASVRCERACRLSLSSSSRPGLCPASARAAACGGRALHTRARRQPPGPASAFASHDLPPEPRELAGSTQHMAC